MSSLANPFQGRGAFDDLALLVTRRSSYSTVWDYLHRNENVSVIGDYGVGKSTFLKFIMRNAQKHLENDPQPIWFSTQDIQKRRDAENKLRDRLPSHWGSGPNIDVLIADRYLLLLLDDLHTHERTKAGWEVRQWLRSLSESPYTNVQLVATSIQPLHECFPSHVEQMYGGSSLHGVMSRSIVLEPFSREEAEELIKISLARNDLSGLFSASDFSDLVGPTIMPRQLRTLCAQRFDELLKERVTKNRNGSTVTPLIGESLSLELTLTEDQSSDHYVVTLAAENGSKGSFIPNSLPYNPEELITVLKALEHQEFDHSRFSAAQSTLLEKLDLLDAGHWAPDRYKRVGQHLYNTLIAGDKVPFILGGALQRAASDRDLLLIQMQFPSTAGTLAMYPWELMCNDTQHLVLAGRAEITRHIAHQLPPSPFATEPPLRMAYVAPRPMGLDELPTAGEHDSLRKALANMSCDEKLSFNVVPGNTYDHLLDFLQEHVRNVHILHFDGHGTFARRCRRCSTLNYPHLDTCNNCSTSLKRISPQGYLAFESSQSADEPHWVSSEDLSNIMFQSGLRLVVLSACSSAQVRGDHLFNGVAPALVQGGVPAVVAMQLAISVEGAERFCTGFYRAVASFRPIVEAMFLGRQRLAQTTEWFIPVLYLRSKDPQGQLFKRSQQQ